MFILVALRLCGITGLLSVFSYLINPAWLAWAAIPLPNWLRTPKGVSGATSLARPKSFIPDRENLRDMRESLPGGWSVATNLNNVLKKMIIKLAADVAGLSFGKDVIIEL